MQHPGPLALGLLALTLVCVTCASGYDPYPGNPAMSAEWKWNYAQSSKTVDDLAAAGVQITDYDITYARAKVASSKKDCSNMGGVWCTYLNNDVAALQRMVDVQARQGSNPSPEIIDIGQVPDLTNVIDSAWKQLNALPTELADWVDDLIKALNFTPSPHST